MSLSPAELEELRLAKRLLEHPGLAVRIGALVGFPIERGFDMLPGKLGRLVNEASRKAIEAALDVALRTLDQRKPVAPANLWHKVAAGASGALGGAFGLPALVVELPVSTTIMMRSIADIARSEGEDLATPEARLQCVQVLALGGPTKGDDAAETGYFATRAAMAKAVSDAVAHLAKKGLTDKGAPALLRLLAQIAARFSLVVSEKAAAQSLPLVGACGGALINALFIDHFQDMGRGHFLVRRLERLYGPAEVRRAYERL